MRTPFSFEVETPLRLDVFLSQRTGKSRQFIQEQIRLGHVSRNGTAISKISQKLTKGDKISGHFEETENFLGLVPVEGNLEIVYEDSDLLILNKAQGIVVHPGAGTRGETLVHYLLHYLRGAKSFLETSATRPGIVHRLDRGTSGLIICAKHRDAHERLSKQFKSRQIKKEYECLAWGKVKAKGKIESIVGRDLTNRKKMSSRTAKGREALTHFETAEIFSHFSHVRLFPHTGRTHQLRVHLSEAGHPIVADAMYGKKTAPKQLALLPKELEAFFGEIKYPFLHARRLTLNHPMTESPLVVEAPAPETFTRALDLLRRFDP